MILLHIFPDGNGVMYLAIFLGVLAMALLGFNLGQVWKFLQSRTIRIVTEKRDQVHKSGNAKMYLIVGFVSVIYVATLVTFYLTLQ